MGDNTIAVLLKLFFIEGRRCIKYTVNHTANKEKHKVIRLIFISGWFIKKGLKIVPTNPRLTNPLS